MILYIPGNNPLMEYSLNDNKYKYFIYAGNKLIAEEKNGVVNYYHTDHLGSTRLVTDASGNKVAEYKFKPYGETENYSGTFSTNYQFTGKPVNADVGLAYFGGRYYDPEVGRFISMDPAKDGNNWYSYCHNNPVNLIDPDGKVAIVPLLYMYCAAIAASPDTPMDMQMLSMSLASGNYFDAALDVASIVIPGVTGLSSGFKAAKKAAQLFANSAKGRAFEKAGLELLGMAKNTQKIGGRIADVLLKNNDGSISAIIEFKNVQNLTKSDQLATFIEQAGKNFSLVVNGDTKIASTLWKQVEEAGGHIYRMVDGELNKIL